MIHSYPSRSYRDPESLEDQWIIIPVIYCAEAKALGKQHYKRLLPDFLIPYGRMRLDTVLEAAEEREKNGSTFEQACRIIGCRDLRTARMHLSRLKEAAGVVALALAEMQATVVHLHDNIYRPRPLAPFERLKELHQQQMQALLRAGEGEKPTSDLRQLLQAALWKRFRKFSMSYVSRPPPER